MVLNRYLGALITGAALSALVVGLLGSLEPSIGLPHLSRSPLADYLALGGAADVSAVAVYFITAFCMSLCLLVTGWCRARRTARMAQTPEPEPATEKEKMWLPS